MSTRRGQQWQSKFTRKITEKVAMKTLTQEVHNDRVSQQQGKAHEHPGQKGGLEVEKAKEVHADVRVPPAPHVHEHYCEGLAQENQAHEQTEKLADGIKENVSITRATGKAEREKEGVCPNRGLRSGSPTVANF